VQAERPRSGGSVPSSLGQRPIDQVAPRGLHRIVVRKRIGNSHIDSPADEARRFTFDFFELFLFILSFSPVEKFRLGARLLAGEYCRR